MCQHQSETEDYFVVTAILQAFPLQRVCFVGMPVKKIKSFNLTAKFVCQEGSLKANFDVTIRPSYAIAAAVALIDPNGPPPEEAHVVLLGVLHLQLYL